MKNRNKLFSLCSSILLSLTAVGCSSKPITKAAIEIDMVSIALTTEYFEYKFDLENYINQNNEPDKDKALMSLLFAATISFGAIVKFENSEILPKNFYDYEPFYINLGLDDFVNVAVGKDKEIDKNDQSNLNLAHKKITVDDKTYDIGLFTVIDSGGGVQWISNFDVGDDIDSYTAMTGDHPEWTDHLAHKGFDISSSRCLPYIEDYISQKMDKNANKIFYVFGHSRGGAVGNLLAKKMIDKGYNTAAYLFAGPSVTTSSDVTSSKYSKIFNWVNTSDLFTKILPANWHLDRYGQTFEFDAEDYKEEFKKINGISMPSGDNSILINALAKLANKREDLYIIDDKFTFASANKIPTEEAANLYAQSYYDLFTDELEDLKIYVGHTISENEDGTYSCQMETCPAFLIILIGTVASNLEEGFDAMPAIGKYAQFLKPFLDVAELSTTDLITLASMLKYVGAMHYYFSYIPCMLA